MESNESIIFRSGLIMGAIVLLALLSMISSVFIAESSKGDAAAINLAGSLRMQSYRIITRLQPLNGAGLHHTSAVEREIVEFERRLGQLWQTGAISLTEDDPRNQTFQTIHSAWRETLKPILKTLATEDSFSTDLLKMMDDFVAKLDLFVTLLEQNTEAKMLLLRLIQGIALFMILVLIFAAMHQLHTRIVVPLRDLEALARKAQRGDLTVRASHVGDDELGVLGRAFNLMAVDLSAMYADLETRVEQQTQALRTSHRSLELLYYTAQRLSEAAPDEATYRALMTAIETLTGTGSVTLCMIDPATHQVTQAFSTRSPVNAIPPFCNRPYCHTCVGDGTTHPLDATGPIFSIPVKDQDRQFGVLIVHNPGLESVAAWQLPLLEAVARHIAATLRANEQANHRWRLELLEERNAIARELHDSLAQSLAYLKIQVSRLHALLGGLETTSEVREIVTELREGLNSAYRQLRELITTFRLKMDQPRLEDSLSEVAREFSRRGRLPIDLDCSGWRYTLKPNEQIHLMHIVREALNNAVKHAHAHRISIQINGLEGSEAVIEIRDDGIGLPAHPEREDHFGLSIMRERIAHLGGTLDFDSQPGHGLRVRIRFTPAAERNAATAITREMPYV